MASSLRDPAFYFFGFRALIFSSRSIRDFFIELIDLSLLVNYLRGRTIEDTASYGKKSPLVVDLDRMITKVLLLTSSTQFPFDENLYSFARRRNFTIAVPESFYVWPPTPAKVRSRCSGLGRFL